MNKNSITNKTDLEIRGALALWYSRSTEETEKAGKAWYAVFGSQSGYAVPSLSCHWKGAKHERGTD